MEREMAVRCFLVTGLAFAVPALVAVAQHDQLALHRIINAHHAPWSDLFFRYATHLADGLVPTVLAVVLLFLRDVRSFLMMGLGCGISAIVVQALKHLVFGAHHRPAGRHAELDGIRWLEGVDLHHHFSFPSGHATAAFAMCLALAVIVARPRWGVVLAAVASVLAFSRVYISQHFTEDVLAGAALGGISAWLVYRWLYRSRFATRPWLDRRPFYLPK
ncbi:MAG: phosphatase PAP2 family protein [Flavobacteriales bacterium]|nr:phosphatase PAP2 family protein [Flavobacteriales bacterium]